jgi:hypothetical protein
MKKGDKMHEEDEKFLVILDHFIVGDIENIGYNDIVLEMMLLQGSLPYRGSLI